MSCSSSDGPGKSKAFEIPVPCLVLSVNGLCLQQTPRNGSPLKLHVWKFHHDENATYRGIEESASSCREAADKLGPTERAQSGESSCVELSESAGARTHVTKQPGKEGRQMRVDTNT